MAMKISDILPAPTQRTFDRDDEEREIRSQMQVAPVISNRAAPPYGHRKGWIPRSQEDFGDGGAFPEIAVAQYPLGMGQKKSSSNSLAVQLDAKGKIKYDAIAKYGHAKDKVVHSKFQDLVPKQLDEDDPSLEKPDEEAIQENTEKTRQALEKLISGKISAAMPVRAAEKQAPAQYIRYTPSQQGVAYNSGAKQRIIRMVEAQKDPMDPPKFKVNKKIPRGPPSPPAPVMHSPNRKVTVKEQQEWKIPPCISNWKNVKGYTIPLDKRLAADGRGLQGVTVKEQQEWKIPPCISNWKNVKGYTIPLDKRLAADGRGLQGVTVKEQQEWKIPPCISNWKNVKGYTIPLDKRLAADGRGLQGVNINENFAKLAEALYIADRKAREAVETRAQIEQKMAQKEKERKEENLRQLAQKAREERAGIRKVDDNDDDVVDRDEIRRDRHKERQRDRNLARAAPDKRSRIQKDRERDISEKIALGLPNTGASQQEQFDQRLFNQSKGMDSGFGDDEAYNVYDKPWRADKNAASQIYRPSRNKDNDTYGDLDEIMKTNRFVPDKGFTGADSSRRRDGPVQFEKYEEEDPFGLDKFLKEAKTGQKRGADDSRSNRDYDRKKRRE